MELTEKYKQEQEDTIKRNFQYRRNYISSPRFYTLAAFCEPFKAILSVGCGSYEPILIKATMAVDVSPLASFFLKRLGFSHSFLTASCDNLPLPDKSFDVAVCSEVIEHLPDLETIQKTFYELDRVAHNWVVTTPCNPIGPLNTEPTHKRAFTFAELEELISFTQAKIYKDNQFYWVVKDVTQTFWEIFNKYNKG